VLEVHTPLLEGYSGVFFENQDQIEISEDLDDLTIIHEVSHSWFNGDLFKDRWLKEGFADAYAERTLDAMGSGPWAPHTVNRTDAAAVALADWTAPGRITDTTTDAREAYGYDTSWMVVRSILAEIGTDGMQAVLQAARAGRIAYLGAGEPETTAGPVDWEHFLDLLDEIGGSATADGLFRQWVIGEEDGRTFDARAVARTSYAALVAAGHGWLPPAYVRVPMSHWDFLDAGQRIPVAGAVLTTRDDIAALVAPLGLDVPTDLRGAYETATDSLSNAQAKADAELAAARSLVAADIADHAERGALTAIGLIGESPDAALDAARAAFQAGSVDAAGRAGSVTRLIAGAAVVGQTRVAATIAIILVLVLLAVAAAVLLRRRRMLVAARVAAAGIGTPSVDIPIIVVAGEMDATGAGAAGPYATLPDQSDEKDDT
jgi:hypothetical protein